MASKLNTARNKVQLGVITFSSEAEIDVKLGEHKDTRNFQEAVNTIPHMGGLTKIDKALMLAREDFFHPSNGARGNAIKILMLITDGSQTIDATSKNPVHFAEQLRHDDVIIIGNIFYRNCYFSHFDIGRTKAKKEKSLKYRWKV